MGLMGVKKIFSKLEKFLTKKNFPFLGFAVGGLI